LCTTDLDDGSEVAVKVERRALGLEGSRVAVDVVGTSFQEPLARHERPACADTGRASRAVARRRASGALALSRRR
jgi:hypothetical protein